MSAGALLEDGMEEGSVVRRATFGNSSCTVMSSFSVYTSLLHQYHIMNYKCTALLFNYCTCVVHAACGMLILTDYSRLIVIIVSRNTS